MQNIVNTGRSVIKDPRRILTQLNDPLTALLIGNEMEVADLGDRMADPLIQRAFRRVSSAEVEDRRPGVARRDRDGQRLIPVAEQHDRIIALADKQLRELDQHFRLVCRYVRLGIRFDRDRDLVIDPVVDLADRSSVTVAQVCPRDNKLNLQFAALPRAQRLDHRREQPVLRARGGNYCNFLHVLPPCMYCLFGGDTPCPEFISADQFQSKKHSADQFQSKKLSADQFRSKKLSADTSRSGSGAVVKGTVEYRNRGRSPL